MAFRVVPRAAAALAVVPVRLLACTKVLEDGGGDVGVFNTGNDTLLAAALGAGLYVGSSLCELLS